ncbi:MAG: hypothetical protein SFV51_21465 [Bryobacteraceae bacterium]|nr:hypothetical protein [Bryobacteraceae bacterium]
MRLMLALLLWVTSVPNWAAEVRPGQWASLNVSRQADVLLPGETVVITDRREGIPLRDPQALRLAIEGAIAGAYAPSQKSASATLTYAVAHVDPVTVRTFSANEKRKVKIRTRKVRRLFVKSRNVDEFEDRQVAAQYWEARGTLRLLITVHAGDELVDSFEPQGSCDRKVETALDGISTNSEILPSVEALQAILVGTIAQQIRARYARTTETVEVPLASAGALGTGNGLAMDGQWKEALAAWEAASAKENPAGRAYNIALAHEALAYRAFDETGNTERAAPAFRMAREYYDQAMSADREQKAYSHAKDRCVRMEAALRAASANAHFHLAAVYSRLSQKDETLKELDAAVDAGYANKEMLETDPRLAFARQQPGFKTILARVK